MYEPHKNVLSEILIKLDGKTPGFIYSEKILSNQCSAIIAPIKNSYIDGDVYFPIKASYEPRILKALVKFGISGFEVMSLHELKHIRALFEYRIPVIFSGLCPEASVFLNLESKQDLLVINSLNDAFSISEYYKLHPPKFATQILMRISFPGLNSKIGYNGRNSKLGIIAHSNEMYRCLAVLQESEHLKVSGLHCHQLIHQSTTDEYKKMFHKMAKLVQSIEATSDFDLTICDIGGGLESLCHDDTRNLMRSLSQEFSVLLPNRKMIFEPGRALINSCGICITKVIGQRIRTELHHCIVDVGTNLLVPTPSKRYRLIQDDRLSIQSDDQSEYPKTVKVTFSDRVLSPANTIVDEVAMSSPPQIGDQVLIGNAGAYTLSLEHQWFQPFHTTYFLDLDNVLTTIFSADQSKLSWMNRLETTV